MIDSQNNFLQRILTGAILIGVILFAVLFSQYSFLIIFLTINLLALMEFYRLFAGAEITSRRIAGTLLSASVFITVSLFLVVECNWKILLFNIPIAFFIFLSELYSGSPHPFQILALTFFGVIYLTIPVVFLISIPFFPFSDGVYRPDNLLGFFFMVWASDSGAFVFGKLMGRHALFKRISPGKTWEGSIGGAICALAVAFFVSQFFTDLNLTDWILIATIVVVIGTYGDLIKSMLKRSLNVKDSGTILPGHGGILDRFDAMLSSAPFVLIYLLVFS